MKRILYDIGQMASLENFKGLRHPSDKDPGWEGSPHPKIEGEKMCLILIIRQKPAF